MKYEITWKQYNHHNNYTGQYLEESFTSRDIRVSIVSEGFSIYFLLDELKRRAKLCWQPVKVCFRTVRQLSISNAARREVRCVKSHEARARSRTEWVHSKNRPGENHSVELRNKRAPGYQDPIRRDGGRCTAPRGRPRKTSRTRDACSGHRHTTR